MKYLITLAITAMLLLCNCNSSDSKGVEFRYTVEVNPSICLIYWNLWKDKIDFKPDADIRIHQTGVCFSAFTGSNTSSTTEVQQRAFFNNFFGYNTGFVYPDMFNFYAKDYQINIIDSISFKKQLTVYKDGKQDFNAIFNFWFYKLRYKDSVSWFLGKIDTYEYFSHPKAGYGHVVYRYGFGVSDNGFDNTITINVPNYLREDINEFGISLPINLHYFSFYDGPEKFNLFDKNKQRMIMSENNNKELSTTNKQYKRYTILYQSLDK